MRLIRILKKTADPSGVNRIAIGGSRNLGGYFLVYRGTKEEAREALQLGLIAMEKMCAELGPDHEPEITPDSGGTRTRAS